MTRSSGSLHEHVRITLAQEITSGAHDALGKIPTEPELCEQFGVSRVTIRRAVSDLEELGLVRRQQGSGTFVTHRSAPLGTMAIGGFADIYSDGGEKSRDLKTAETISADEMLAAALQVAPGTPVFHLQRVFRLDGVPLALDSSHYSLDRFPGLDQLISHDTSTYRVLRDRYGVHFSHVKREIGIGFTTPETATWLDRPERDPLLIIEKTAVDRDDRVIHTSHIESVPDRVRLRATAYEDQPA